MLHSPCSVSAIDRAKRKCARRSSVWATLQIFRPARWPQSRVRFVDGHVLGVSRVPIGLTHRDNQHQPRPSSVASVVFAMALIPLWLRLDLGYLPHVHELQAPSPAYLPEYAAFCRLSSYQRRTREAPFFGCLHGLAIQNRRAGFRPLADRSTHLPSQGVVNTFPRPIQTPRPEVRVHRLPRGQVMR